MNLREVLAALRATWWLPLVAMIVGGAAALSVSLLQTPLYTSSTQLFVSTTGSTTAADLSQGSQFAQQRVASYAHIITGPDMARRVIQRLGLSMSAQELQGEIAAAAVTNTVLLDVTVTDPSADQAKRIADAVGAEFIAYAGQLEASDANGFSSVKVSVTETPEVPSSPSSPQTVRNLGLGLFAGLLVGAGLSLGRARLDRSVKDTDEVSRLVHAPVLGVVLRDQVLQDHHVIDHSSTSRTVESFRQLRTNLQYLNVDEPPRTILVSSAVETEGKSTLVINLALALTEMGRKVTIVEADLRRPQVARYLRMEGHVGLTNILAGTAELDEVVQRYGPGDLLDEVVQRYGPGDLAVLAAGPTPPDPGALLASNQMSALLQKLRGQSDFVLIDSAPLLSVADTTPLATHTDGVLLSVRYGVTRTDQLRQAAATLERVGAKVLGVILNLVPPKAETTKPYGYGYGYGSGYGKGLRTGKHGRP